MIGYDKPNIAAIHQNIQCLRTGFRLDHIQLIAPQQVAAYAQCDRRIIDDQHGRFTVSNDPPGEVKKILQARRIILQDEIQNALVEKAFAKVVVKLDVKTTEGMP